MLSPSEISAVSEPLARLIESNGIKFERGNPRQYFAQLGLLSVGLTLPLVPREHLATVVLLKNYCNLWNIVVDDEIDREGGRRHLDASMQLLTLRLQGRSDQVPDSGAARVLHEMLELLPATASPAKERLRQALYFDLWEEMTGFSYEHCINSVRAAANSVEYGKYSTMTASIKHFLDLDCLFAADELEDTVYRKLRTGYEFLGQAVKFASDLGTLKRELLEEDNLNIVRILALESGLPGMERKLETEAQYEALLPSLQDIFVRSRKLALDNLESARALLAPVTEVDTRPLVKTISGLVESYCKRDPFFQKQR
ncbi:terpene synthase family protein [Archangium sp.]|jgi:hypothetical protein|uniref:terpene synthase family protein n=1 Tax=Archangium sp. TaxID=1872627 RepID=UPI002ED8FA40